MTMASAVLDEKSGSTKPHYAPLRLPLFSGETPKYFENCPRRTTNQMVSHAMATEES